VSAAIMRETTGPSRAGEEEEEKTEHSTTMQEWWNLD